MVNWNPAAAQVVVADSTVATPAGAPSVMTILSGDSGNVLSFCVKAQARARDLTCVGDTFLFTGSYADSANGYRKIFIAEMPCPEGPVLQISHSETIFPIDIFPNPNEGNFTIVLGRNNALKLREIAFHDVAGKLIYRRSMDSGWQQTQVEVQIPGLPAGIYVLRMMADAGIATTRLLVR